MAPIRRVADEPRTLAKTELPPYLLQHELVDVLQMAFQVKQAQWSLVNQDSDLSMTLSDLSRASLSWADEIVRAMARLGTPPDGRVTTVGSSSNLINLEPEWRTERDVAELAGSRCRTFAIWAGERAADPGLEDEAIKSLFDRIVLCFGDYESKLKECVQP